MRLHKYFPLLRMKFFQRLCTLALVAVPFMAQAAGISVLIDGRTVVFTDVPQEAWYATYVRDAAQADIVNGYKDARGNLTGRFGPTNSVTVAEAMKIAVEGAGYDANLYGSVIASGYSTHWASKYMSVAKSEGFTFVKNNSFINLNRAATRAEVASIFTSAFRVDLAVSAASSFTDVPTSADFSTSINALNRDKVISGDTDAAGVPQGTFRPTSAINRAEVVKFVMNARATYGMPGVGRKPPEQSDTKTVIYTNAGFSPQVLRVPKGTQVTFRNDTTSPMWVASDPHPTHTNYPGFDALKSMNQGQVYVFTFTKTGSWGYHNHLNPSQGGTIVVE